MVVSWGKRNAVVPMPIRPTARRERGSGSGIEVDILSSFWVGGRLEVGKLSMMSQ